MKEIISGKIWKFGDNIDTDQIIPSQYLLLPDIKEMVPHIFEPINPEFPNIFRPGDIIIAGKNFGCGSSREQAVEVIKILGFFCVIAESFSRLFYRNAINNGLPVFEVKGISSMVKEKEKR